MRAFIHLQDGAIGAEAVPSAATCLRRRLAVTAEQALAFVAWCPGIRGLRAISPRKLLRQEPA